MLEKNCNSDHNTNQFPNKNLCVNPRDYINYRPVSDC